MEYYYIHIELYGSGEKMETERKRGTEYIIYIKFYIKYNI